MNNKLLLLLSVVVLLSCGNNEENAYKVALNSTNTAILQDYLSKYEEDAPAEHLTEISSRLTELTNDSLDYSIILRANNIDQRYNSEVEYLQKHPKGLHFKEVDSMLNADKPAYNEMKLREEEAQKKDLFEKKYGELRDKMIDFYYTNNKDEDVLNLVFFDAPNEQGKGKGLIVRGGYRSTFSYEIKDNEDIFLQLKSVFFPKRGIAHFYLDDVFVNLEGKETAYNRAYNPELYSKFINSLRKGELD